MTFFRIFSALTADDGCDWYDETENPEIMTDGIAHLVNIGSDFSVRIYPSRHAFMEGLNPYALMECAGDGVILVIDAFSYDRVSRMHVNLSDSLGVAERVGARVRTLEKKYAQFRN